MHYVQIKENLNKPYNPEYYKNLSQKKKYVFNKLNKIKLCNNTKLLIHFVIKMHDKILVIENLIKTHSTFSKYFYNYVLRRKKFWKKFNKNCNELNIILDNIRKLVK